MPLVDFPVEKRVWEMVPRQIERIQIMTNPYNDKIIITAVGSPLNYDIDEERCVILAQQGVPVFWNNKIQIK